MNAEVSRLPRTASKQEIYSALDLVYVDKNGRIRYRYTSIHRDFFTPEYVEKTLGLSMEAWSKLKVLNYQVVKRICQDFDILPEDFR